MNLTALSSPTSVDNDDSVDSDDSFEDGDVKLGPRDWDMDLFDPDKQDPAILSEKTSSNSHPEKNLISMIQHQQAMLQQALEGQKHLVERQDSFEQQLAELASKVEQPLSSTPSSSSSEGKRKRVVTRILSVSPSKK